MRVALIHDYLTQHGGAERVLEALRGCYPEATVFTSVVDFRGLPAGYREWPIEETALGRLPGGARLRRVALPLYPSLFRGLAARLRPYDLVLSDSSAWAHHAPAARHAVHVCYCHTPARFLYGDRAYLGPARLPLPLRPVAAATFAALRPVDRRAAARVDRYLANSGAVAARIRAVYGREATVVYPPVDLARFPAPAHGVAERLPEGWFLVVSRLVPHKRVDLAIAACERLGVPLKVIGEGRAGSDLRRRAGGEVEFLGQLHDAAVADHLGRCRALLLPAEEDFGLTAVEAQAAGRPVIALGAGGALETVVPGETGILFPSPTVEALVEAIEEHGGRAWSPPRARANAARFGLDRFQREIMAQVAAATGG